MNLAPEMHRRSIVLGRRTIYLSMHAMERYYERSGGRTLQDLERALDGARWIAGAPSYARMSVWHQGRCEGHVPAGPGAFCICREPNRELVASTYVIPGGAW